MGYKSMDGNEGDRRYEILERIFKNFLCLRNVITNFYLESGYVCAAECVITIDCLLWWIAVRGQPSVQRSRMKGEWM